MKVAQLSPSTRARLMKSRYDSIVEKHEGPFSWEWTLDESEFLRVGDFDVLLPIDRRHQGNISIVRVIPSADGQSLTVFLKDTTYSQGDDDFFAGFVAVCDRFPDDNFFVAVVYHEWFTIEKPFGDA